MEINESGEHALLRIMLEHLEVTERFLAHYVKLARAVRRQPEIAANLPAIEQPPKLQELHVSTQKLTERVRAILDQK